MTTTRPIKMPQPVGRSNRIIAPDTRSNDVGCLHALLETPPKRAVIRSREIVATNKGDILKALRRGHRVEDIAKALSIPNRTFVRRLKELDISARSVRKQYHRWP